MFKARINLTYLKPNRFTSEMEDMMLRCPMQVGDTVYFDHFRDRKHVHGVVTRVHHLITTSGEEDQMVLYYVQETDPEA